MAEAKYDITIQSHGDWEMQLIFKDEAGTPKDLTDYEAVMQIRDRPEGEVLIELDSTTPAGITITAGEGKVHVAMTNEETGALHVRKAVWDLQLNDGGTPAKITYPIGGDATIVAAVTL